MKTKQTKQLPRAVDVSATVAAFTEHMDAGLRAQTGMLAALTEHIEGAAPITPAIWKSEYREPFAAVVIERYPSPASQRVMLSLIKTSVVAISQGVVAKPQEGINSFAARVRAMNKPAATATTTAPAATESTESGSAGDTGVESPIVVGARMLFPTRPEVQAALIGLLHADRKAFETCLIKLAAGVTK
jgi:hypothetical protein